MQAAKDAKASELAADDSAIEASTSAQSAGESASAAATSASNAAKSAGEAAKSASDAKAAADKAVEDASDLLKTYTDNAKTSADNAATSASSAADSASAASGSASAAAQSATDASNAKVAAQTAKDEAATSASNAASSATAAAQSASDAAASAGEMLTEAKKYTDANTSNALVSTVSGKLLHVEDAWPGKPLSVTIDGAYKQDGTPSPENPVPITVVENPVLRVTGADTSVAGTSLPITLPAEHPYLAALPDGTHDEIVIDKDGNVSLVARVFKFSSQKIAGYQEKANGADFQVMLVTDVKFGTGTSISNICRQGNVDEKEPVNGGVIKGEFVRLTRPESVTDLTSAVGYLRELSFENYFTNNATVTYQLGKVTVPSLPETISNVWTDAELTTNMSMTYKQDVNVVIADLTAQIAALKGTNDILHDDSTASPDDAIDVPDNSETLDVAGTVG